MRLNSSPFARSVFCTPSIYPNIETDFSCPECSQEYSINADRTLTTTLKNGIILVAYMRKPTAESGEILIPDIEELKEAILHYCL